MAIKNPDVGHSCVKAYAAANSLVTDAQCHIYVYESSDKQACYTPYVSTCSFRHFHVNEMSLRKNLCSAVKFTWCKSSVAKYHPAHLTQLNQYL